MTVHLTDFDREFLSRCGVAWDTPCRGFRPGDRIAALGTSGEVLGIAVIEEDDGMLVASWRAAQDVVISGFARLEAVEFSGPLPLHLQTGHQFRLILQQITTP